MSKLDEWLEDVADQENEDVVCRLLAIVYSARGQRNGAVIAHFGLAGKLPHQMQEAMESLDEDLYRSAMEAE